MPVNAFFTIFISSYLTSFKIYAMGYPTKIQIIKRAKSEQWYINLPAALARAMEFEKGEVVEWLVEDRLKLVLKRSDKVMASKKKPPTSP